MASPFATTAAKPRRGGAFSIAPAFEVARARQMYLPETNVLLLEHRLERIN
jgi:hypothetical protein